MSKAKELISKIEDTKVEQAPGPGPGANVGTNIIRNAVTSMEKDLKLMKSARQFLGASPEARKAVKLIDGAVKTIKKSL